MDDTYDIESELTKELESEHPRAPPPAQGTERQTRSEAHAQAGAKRASAWNQNPCAGEDSGVPGAPPLYDACAPRTGEGAAGPHYRLHEALMAALDETSAAARARRVRAVGRKGFMFTSTFQLTTTMCSLVGGKACSFSRVTAAFMELTYESGILEATYALLAVLLIAPFQEGPLWARAACFVAGNALLIALARSTSFVLMWIAHSLFMF